MRYPAATFFQNWHIELTNRVYRKVFYLNPHQPQNLYFNLIIFVCPASSLLPAFHPNAASMPSIKVTD